MTHRERIRAIIAGEPADRCGFWLGHPHAELWPLLHKHFGTRTEAELRLLLQDDLVLRSAEYQGAAYDGPEAAIFFDILNPPADPPLADCTDPVALADFPWPSAGKFSTAPSLAALRSAGDVYRCGGMWCPFFHVMVSLFGMENYLAKMWEQPELIHAATDRVCQFYYDANEKVFAAAGDLMDGFFSETTSAHRRTSSAAPGISTNSCCRGSASLPLRDTGMVTRCSCIPAARSTRWWNR